MNELRAPAKPCPVCGVALARVPTDGCSIVYRCYHCKTEVVKPIRRDPRAPASHEPAGDCPFPRIDSSAERPFRVQPPSGASEWLNGSVDIWNMPAKG
jgi:hypothetical protein